MTKQSAKHRKPLDRTRLLDNLFTGFNTVFLLLIAVVMIYPFYWLFCTSVANPASISSESVKLLPKGFQLEAYKFVVQRGDFWLSYWNSIRYTVVGTVITLIITSLTGYVLSIKNYSQRKWLTVYFTITLFLDGGLIPTYLNILNLGLVDTIWAITLPAATSLWYTMIMRTCFSGISGELREAALVDGANDLQIFLKVMLPLAKATIATVTLFAAIGYWNNLMKALLYLNDNKLQPLTVYLRNLLVTGDTDAMSFVTREMMQNVNESGAALGMRKCIRMSTVVLTILPVMCIYPFVQRYFVKGVMLGSVKG